MYTEPRSSVLRTAFIVLFAAILFSASQVFAQQGIENLETKKIDEYVVTVGWDDPEGASSYDVFYVTPNGEERYVGFTNDTGYTIKGLRFDTEYEIRIVASDGRVSTIRVHTKDRPQDQIKLRPTVKEAVPRSTCPQLSDAVVITGYHASTQCVIVDGSGVGRMDLVKRGIVIAVDIWGYVPNPIEVCFRSAGAIVFLDADYAPRMLMEIETHRRDGMTCGAIDRAGTVVLLAPIAGEIPPAQPTAAQATLPTVETPPVFESIPLDDCLIKLVETLYLRATPGGEIIGLVWRNSEAPAFEINGYWYKIEFEGQIGYISRYHRKVLRGGCG